MNKIPTSRKIDVRDYLPNLESRHILFLEYFFEGLLFPLLMVYIHKHVEWLKFFVR